GCAVIGLSHCRMVTDSAESVSGLDVATTQSHRQDCTKRCHKQLEEALRQEQRHFQDAIRECGSDKSCRKAEQINHREVVMDLRQQERRCKSTCYNEGSGGAR